MTERRADDATRDVTAWLKCEYMQEHVGDSFSGVISGVTGFGLFVELSDIYVEGLVHITALTSDYYHFDPAHHRLTGENSGRIYRLGDTIKVTVARVDLDERKIDFVLAKVEGETDTTRAKKPSNKSRKPSGKSKADQPSKTNPAASQKPASNKKPASRKPRKKKPTS
jgi:ribonuclease R